MASDVNSFLTDVYALAADFRSHLGARQAIRLVFSFFDQHIYNAEFDVCEEALRHLDLDRVNDAVSTAFLAITLQAKSKIPGRAAFLERIERNLQARRPEDVETLLKGLR